MLIHFVAKKCGGAGQGGGGVRSLVRRSAPKDCALFNHSVAYLYLVGCSRLVGLFSRIEAKISGGTGGCSIGGGGGTPTIMLSKYKKTILFILFIKNRYQIELIEWKRSGKLKNT